MTSMGKQTRRTWMGLTVARMARDFLAIPGTSVSVERLFLKSGHICTDLRTSMKADTLMKSLLTAVWIKSGLFGPELWES